MITMRHTFTESYPGTRRKPRTRTTTTYLDLLPDLDIHNHGDPLGDWETFPSAQPIALTRSFRHTDGPMQTDTTVTVEGRINPYPQGVSPERAAAWMDRSTKQLHALGLLPPACPHAHTDTLASSRVCRDCSEVWYPDEQPPAVVVTRSGLQALLPGHEPPSVAKGDAMQRTLF